jgi:dipeptidyl-peptidase-4
LHQGSDATGEGAQEDHRYPFAGEANAKIRLGVVSVEGGEPVWMDLGPEEDIYLARVKWLPDGRLSAQIQNREQSRLDLIFFDPATGEGTPFLQETTDVWINLHDVFRPLKEEREDGGRYIWASERTGFRHLYLLDGEGNIIRPLTGGDWLVDALSGVDEEGGLLYFTASKESPTESHLYDVPLSGGGPRRITAEPGMHSVTIDHGFKHFVDVHHALDKPPDVTLRSLADGAILHRLFNDVDPRIEALGLKAPELVTLPARDGETLYGLLYRPPGEFGHGPFPTLVSVYGGPIAQRVTKSWGATADVRAQYYRSLGFVVFVLDNRGSARRGLHFEGAVKHDFGRLEVQDQVDGVRWLVDQGLTDPDRVGIYGWSYGGYMGCMALALAPETFKAAVAGAPVTQWDGYDTHYTERYMGTPQSNPDGYRSSSPVNHVDKIKGHLMLVHGLIDENVHFRHTARFINALVGARKRYELLLFPDARHGPRKLADRVYMEEIIRDFFVENL